MTSPANIAVLMGGTSAEREISLKTGRAVARALQSQGLNVDAVDYQGSSEQLWQLTEFDLVFIALHGPLGEDGTIQGFLEMLNVPYTGSGVLSSALAMDKWRSKCLWQHHSLLTPPFLIIDHQTDTNIIDQLGLPICIKPTLEGSSFGITKVTEAAQLRAAIRHAQQYGTVIAEKWIEGSEYTVGIVGEHILPSIRIETPRQFYDYDAKYTVDSTHYHCPSGLNEQQEKQIQLLAKHAFDLLGCQGWGRIDFMADTQGNFYLIELNTIPGLTETSLVPKAAKQYGWTFSELLQRIIGAQ